MKEPLIYDRNAKQPDPEASNGLTNRIGLLILTIISLLLAIFLSSCASRPLYDAGGAAAGGGVAYALSDGNPLYTLGGAAGGVLVSEYLQNQGEKGRFTAYNRGYDRGRSDGTKQQYQAIQNSQKGAESKNAPTPTVRYYPVPAPPAKDGSKQVPSEIYIPVPVIE